MQRLHLAGDPLFWPGRVLVPGQVHLLYIGAVLAKVNRVTPQERIAQRLGVSHDVISNHLRKSSELKNSVNSQLGHGFGVNTIAEKLEWPEPLVWAVALEGKDDRERFEELKWNIRPWDYWSWGDVDHRFGDHYPGRIPAQLVAHVLYFFTSQGSLIFDPMAGGVVTADVCLAFNRRCWSLDKKDRPLLLVGQ